MTAPKRPEDGSGAFLWVQYADAIEAENARLLAVVRGAKVLAEQHRIQANNMTGKPCPCNLCAALRRLEETKP